MGLTTISLSKENILRYSEKYDRRYINTEDANAEKSLKYELESSNYITRDQFIRIGLWKSKRPQKKYCSQENTDDFIKEVTSIAFGSGNERIRVEVLQLMKGCSYPLASVILHFKYPDSYPILDFRALWSLGIEKPANYNFGFWWDYVGKIRQISKANHVSIRELDRALWSYSKENQKNS